MFTYLITGGTGFIGYHLSVSLLEKGNTVIVFDRKNPIDRYQQQRKSILESYENFIYYEGNLEEKSEIEQVFINHTFDKVCHLAAKTGVRNKGKGNEVYFQSNVLGFFNILELIKNYEIEKFVFASSSSVYGNNTKIPFSVLDKTDSPISFYAATKKSNEIFAYSYAELYNLNITGLRFFTVYGPLGRSNMMMDMFTAEETIQVHNEGKMKRDFTHVSDIVRGIELALEKNEKFGIYNLGGKNPVSLEYIIELLERNIGKKAKKIYVQKELGEVQDTWSDIEYTTKHLGWKPEISIEDGIEKFIKGFSM